MANITIVSEPPLLPPVKGIILTLTLEEAQDLFLVVANIAGPPSVDNVRSSLSGIYKACRDTEREDLFPIPQDRTRLKGLRLVTPNG